MRKIAYCLLAAFAVFFVLLTAPTRADDYPYQAHPLTLDGTLSSVDTDRDRVILSGGDGRRYTLDTSQTDITLMDGNQAGLTNDLKSGMRVHLAGKLLSQGIVEADQLRILSEQLRRPVNTIKPGTPFTVHGNVLSTDTNRGSFVVRINDHTRTIYVSDQTDMSGMGRGIVDPLPVRVGDRVIVAGILAGDGSVQADAVSLGRTIPSGGAAYRSGHELSGHVTGTSNRFTSRDITVQDPTGREVTVRVPSRTPVRRDGQPISVHEISKDDQVRIIGSYDGDNFKATRIDDYPRGEGL